MTEYRARWDNSPFEADKLRMLARTVMSVEPVLAVSSDAPSGAAVAGCEACMTRSGDSCADHPPAGERDAVEPVLAGQQDFSDLIALAGPFAAGDEQESASMLLADDVDESNPLAALTREYRQALLSRKSGYAHELKTATVDHNAQVITAQQDAFADLTNHPHAEASVLDLLTKGKNIDTLLDSLDTFGAGQLFEADERREILSLLAPRGLPARRSGQAAQLAREEHHMISVDSHMAMPDPIEYDELEPPDESHH